MENLVSTGRGGERRAASPPPPPRWRLPQPAPTSPRRPGACTPPPSDTPPRSVPSPRPCPALRARPALLPLPSPISLASLSLLVPLPTPAPLTLTHPGAIFSPPSLQSRASPILGLFPRQPWPSPTPPGVGGWVCIWRAGEGSWGHGVVSRGGYRRREQGGELRAAGGARCLAGSINGAREFRPCLRVPQSVSIPGCSPQAAGQALACTTAVAVGVSVWPPCP